nr:hypothetical protein [Tanacetum cinerariifolium]
RSGRFRGWRLVVEENTIDEAIYVHEEDSEDDFVLVSYPSKQLNGSNGETVNVATKDTCADTKAGPSKVNGIPLRLGFYVVDKFDPVSMEIKLKIDSMVVNNEVISEMLRLKNEGDNILMNEVSGNKEMIQDWKDQFDFPVKEITPSIIKLKIRRPTVVDFNFKLNILMLFANIMGCCKKTGPDRWKKELLNNFFCGPVTLLMERETKEIKSGGFGLGEKEGPFVEEDENGFSDDLEVMNLQTGGGNDHNNFQTRNSSASMGKSGEIDKAEVLETVERVTSSKLKGKAVDIDDILSFSLGVTQDFEEYNSGVITVVSTNVIQPIQATASVLANICGDGRIKNATLSADVRYNPFKDYMQKAILKDQRWMDFKDVELYWLSSDVLKVSCFKYLTTVGHTKASAIFTANLNFMRMKCQSKSKSASWGVYAMRHMETYMGNMMEKCECGLDVDGCKHTSQINKLRVKYAAKILLSGCNIHHKKVGDLLNGKLALVDIENLSLLFFKHNPQLQFDFPYSASLGHDPVPIIPNPEPFNNQTIDELPQTLPSFDRTCYSKDGNSFTYDSKSNLVHDSPNVFDPPSQPLVYLCEFYGNDAHYGHYCTPQVLFTYPEPCYNQDFNFPQDFHIFNNNIFVVKTVGVLMNPTNYGDEHLNTVLATESDELRKSSVENLVLIPSESEGVPGNMCDLPFHDNPPPLNISKDQFEDFSDSNDDSTSIDDDSFFIDNIEYVEASPLNCEFVSSEVMEIVIPKVGGIDDDILLTIKYDILREKLLNINLLIANIKALKDNPALSSDFMTKSSSTSLNFLLEETNTFDNSLPKFKTFCFNFGSTTTHSDSSLYDSFIFDLSINPFPPADRSDFYEFADELAHIISPPEYDCFCFKNEPNAGDFTMDVVEDIFPTREPRVHVHNVLPTHPNL